MSNFVTAYHDIEDQLVAPKCYKTIRCDAIKGEYKTTAVKSTPFNYNKMRLTHIRVACKIINIYVMTSITQLSAVSKTLYEEEAANYYCQAVGQTGSKWQSHRAMCQLARHRGVSGTSSVCDDIGLSFRRWVFTESCRQLWIMIDYDAQLINGALFVGRRRNIIAAASVAIRSITCHSSLTHTSSMLHPLYIYIRRAARLLFPK